MLIKTGSRTGISRFHLLIPSPTCGSAISQWLDSCGSIWPSFFYMFENQTLLNTGRSETKITQRLINPMYKKQIWSLTSGSSKSKWLDGWGSKWVSFFMVLNPKNCFKKDTLKQWYLFGRLHSNCGSLISQLYSSKATAPILRILETNDLWFLNIKMTRWLGFNMRETMIYVWYPSVEASSINYTPPNES